MKRDTIDKLLIGLVVIDIIVTVIGWFIKQVINVNNKYSVERFINEDLEMTMNKFASETGYSQGRLSNWKNRNPKKVDDLPVSILKLLAEKSGLTMEEVYNKLTNYENDWNNKTVRK